MQDWAWHHSHLRGATTIHHFGSFVLQVAVIVEENPLSNLDRGWYVLRVYEWMDGSKLGGFILAETRVPVDRVLYFRFAPAAGRISGRIMARNLLIYTSKFTQGLRYIMFSALYADSYKSLLIIFSALYAIHSITHTYLTLARRARQGHTSVSSLLGPPKWFSARTTQR